MGNQNPNPRLVGVAQIPRPPPARSPSIPPPTPAMDRPPIDPILLRLLIHVAVQRIRRRHLSDAAPEDQPVEASNRVPPPPPGGPSFLRLLLRLPLHQIRRILPPDAEPTDQLVEANSVVLPPPTDPSLLHFVLYVALHRILARRATATSWRHSRLSMAARAGPSHLRFALHHALRWIRRLPMATAALSGALMVIASGPLQSLHLTAADTLRFIRRMALQYNIHDFLPSPMVTNNRQGRQLLRLLRRHLLCSHITREMFALWTIFCCVCVTFEYFTTRTVNLQTTTDSNEVVSHVGNEEVSVANCGMPLAVVDDPVHVERSTAVTKNVKKVVSSLAEAESAISEWEDDKTAVIAVDVPADISSDTALLIDQYFREGGADVPLQGSTITSMLQRADEPQVELSGSESSMGPLKVSVEKQYQTVCSPLHSPDRHVDK